MTPPSRPTSVPGRIRSGLFLALALFTAVFTGAAHAGEARVRKVLPSLLDLEGRASLHPSLYERDAYQAYLRRQPELVGGMRLDVNWSAPRDPAKPLELRLQLRGSPIVTNGVAHSPGHNGGNGTNGTVTIVQTVEPPRFGSRWTRIVLDDATRKRVGDVSAWKATLWRDGKEIASTQSFLW